MKKEKKMGVAIVIGSRAPSNPVGFQEILHQLETRIRRKKKRGATLALGN